MKKLKLYVFPKEITKAGEKKPTKFNAYAVELPSGKIIQAKFNQEIEQPMPKENGYITFDDEALDSVGRLLNNVQVTRVKDENGVVTKKFHTLWFKNYTEFEPNTEVVYQSKNSVSLASLDTEDLPF